MGMGRMTVIGIDQRRGVRLCKLRHARCRTGSTPKVDRLRRLDCTYASVSENISKASTRALSIAAAMLAISQSESSARFSMRRGT